MLSLNGLILKIFVLKWGRTDDMLGGPMCSMGHVGAYNGILEGAKISRRLVLVPSSVASVCNWCNLLCARWP